MTPAPVSPKLISFYLPQYHPVPENDEWWGEGFTEWRNVTRARPNFRGHAQPRLPADLGFYDLRLPETRAAQANLARTYGIGGFCYYYYWFSGRRILERPFDEVVASGQPDFPFCICWANENWTRTWDGAEKEVLIRQEYRRDDPHRFIRDIMPILRDPRYIRVNGKPLLMVYRADLVPDIERTADIWRRACETEGLGGVCLGAVQFWNIDSPRPFNFDVAVEFPPHNYMLRETRLSVAPQDIAKEFTGIVFDYEKVLRRSLTRPTQDYPMFRGIVPDWDNTARRQQTGWMLANGSPQKFGYWLRGLIDQARDKPDPANELIFINAWNEWGEGAYLEPDQMNGRAYLDEVRLALAAEPAVEDIAAWAEQQHLGAMLGQDEDIRAVVSHQQRIISGLSEALTRVGRSRTA